MKMRKYSLPMRMIAMVLSLVLIISAMPSLGLFAKVSAATINRGIISTVADANTMESWKDVFNPTNISTEHAGGVWTDKSVIMADNIANAFGNISGLEAGANNFLVALSALAANSVIVGQGSTPTDTIFVLDISGSMTDTDLRSMVAAANDAIHTLLTANEKNRVGVVLYASSSSVLLPLDRYTPVTETQNNQPVIEYIEYSGSRIRAARVGRQNNYTYIKDGNGNSVTSSVEVGGGTYIQSGLWEAWNVFNSATVTDNRTPCLVLMSDGDPTFVTNDFNNVPDDYESGDGNSSGNGEGFLTQLTAAYVKEKIAQKYSSSGFSATAYMYTLGLGVSASGDTVSVAEAVLDTTQIRSGMEDYWNTYLGLASKSDKTMDVEVHYESWWDSGTHDVTVTYDSLLSAKAQMSYVDKYFPADSASQLSAAFKGIVNEISLKSSYYVTRLDGTDANTSGYITFVDEIGTGMQVKEIEGILIGDHLYTGLLMAQALENGTFNTPDGPTAMGDNMVWALIQRLGLKDAGGLTATEIAKDLLNKAYTAGQLRYVSDTNWSNYIGWFGDKDGNYLGFWDAEDPDAAIPEGAAFANKCYGMLGTTTADQTAHASDMMYVAVQVSKPVTNGTIQSKSPETVTFRVPASLLPVVTYQISVETGSSGVIEEGMDATITYNAADPIRLVYEVGVHSELTPDNISQFVREGYQAKDENGNYYLYTNAWNWENADNFDWNDKSTHPQKGDEVLKDTGKNAITYAYFEPGEENEHYYFTDDSLVYVKDGNSYVPYEGTTQPSGNYYFKHLVYTGTANGSDAVSATISAHYEELSSAALKLTEPTAGANTWYVPEGTMHRNMHDHDRDKDPNATGSFFAVRHQLVDTAVDGDVTHHYEIVYLGNNGRITYSPAQGFTLTKRVNDGDLVNNTFTFKVTVTGDTDGKVTVVRGTEGTEHALNNGVLELVLSVNETVSVTGLDTGAAYTIQEIIGEGIKLNAITADNTAQVDLKNRSVTNVVLSNTVQAVTFVNGIQYYGSLRVGKEITYLKGSQPAGANTDSFAVKVTFSGLGGESIYADGKEITLDADGAYTFRIVDGQTVLFAGIPADTVYDVTELAIPGSVIPEGYTAEDGYTIVKGKDGGSIHANHTYDVVLKNQYEPDDLVFDDGEPKIEIEINKTLIGSLTEWDFDFELLHYNGTAWENVKVDGNDVTASVDETNSSVTFDMEGVVLSTVGNHYFRVAEVIPEDQTLGMTYDRTFHDFVVTVVDDLSGQLKISSVESVQHATVTDPVDGDNDGVSQLWNVTTNFTNTYSAESTKLTIQANKTLYNITTGEEIKMVMRDGQFQFTLYSADGNFENLVKIEDSRNGIAGQIIFTPFTYEPSANGDQVFYYVVKETSTVDPGYTVDGTVYKIAVTVATENTTGSGVRAVISKITVQKNDEAAVEVTDTVLNNENVLNGTSLNFKNTYKATHAEVTISGIKTLQNLTPGAAKPIMAVPENAFSFTLVGDEGTAETVRNDANGEFAFTKLTYATPGTYTYTVTENQPADASITKDSTVHTITVVVKDNGAGQLVATVTSESATITGTAAEVKFHNTYKAAPVTGITLSGNKDLQVSQKFNRPLKSGEFRFTLTKPDGTTETVYNDANGNFTFSALTFDTVGSYTYQIQEVHAGITLNGVSYDPNTIEVTIDVVDGGNGKLVAKVGETEITNYSIGTFTNTYTAQPVNVELTAHKYLVGDRELQANEFSFTLTKPDGTTESVKNSADGLIQFSGITFDSVGTYVYTIAEDKLDENGNALTPNAEGIIVYKGVTYSLLEYTVTINIIDNGSGSLVAHITTVDNHGNEYPAQFFNRYEAESVTVTLSGDKDLSDLSSLISKTLDDFEFKFVLTDADGNVIETVSDNGSGFTFTGITFNKPTEEVYYIYELDEGLATITYDATVYKVTVKVTDNLEGNLVADVTYETVTEDPNGGEVTADADEIVFTNTYEAKETSVAFTGLKTFDGGRKLKAGEFSFILKNAAGTEIESVSNDENGVFTFSAITFNQEGTYVYNLEEVQGTDDKVSYDGTKYTLTVTVTDVNGELQAVTEVTVNGEPAEDYGFTNIFTPDDVQTTIDIEKILVNNTDEEIGLNGFLFDLYCNETGKTVTVTSGTDGLAQIELSFSAEDIGKTYTYKLTERKGTVERMVYSDTVYVFSITVGQNPVTGELTLTATRNGAAFNDTAKFINTYLKEATIVFTGLKTFQGGRKLQPGEFSFILKDATGAEIETVTNDANGVFTFSTITFNREGTFVYTLEEVKGTDDKVTYDGTKYTLTVTVTNENGKLQAVTEVTVDNEPAEGYGFTNIFTPDDVHATIGIEKILVNNTDEEIGLKGFLFDLYCHETGETLTIPSGIDGLGMFRLTFTPADIGKTFTYKLTERKGTMERMIYSDVSYAISITVGQNEETGELTLAVLRNGEEITDNAKFTNVYLKEAKVEFSGLKTLTGRKLKAGEFSFLLTNPDGSTETVTNDANGVFAFSTITFNQEGTYVYTMEEVKGTDSKVTYDGTKYTLTVTVTNVDGKLIADVDITADGQPVENTDFANVFTPGDAETSITIEKVLDNKSDKDMGPGGFLFDLYCNETGKTITVTSDAEGLAQIDLTFTPADIGKTYTYKLTEQEGDMKYMIYSDVVYNISITVGQDEETGELTLAVTRDGKAMTENAKFVNVYAVPMSPETGDNSHVELFAIMMGVSAVCLLAVLVLNKKFLR